MPPTRRPFPRFIADASQESRPYGRWEERLRDEFASACEPLAAEAGSALDPETVRWFPDRAWGGRVYVPACGRAAETVTGEDGESVLAEFYGWVSFAPGDGDDERARRPALEGRLHRRHRRGQPRLADRHQRRRDRLLAHRRRARRRRHPDLGPAAGPRRGRGRPPSSTASRSTRRRSPTGASR